jgi:hypothetical protein
LTFAFRAFARGLFDIRWQLVGRGMLPELSFDESLTKIPA